MALRRGANGEEVKRMQSLLAKSGIQLKVDGSFGPGTERAVRLFQRRFNLVPDGVVGARTSSTLNDPSDAVRARNRADLVQRLGSAGQALSQSADAVVVATAPALLSVSWRGLALIYKAETGVDIGRSRVTGQLHFPEGASGVTIGAGYDMKARSAAEIEQDMLAIGVDVVAARSFAAGAGKTGEQARRFCDENKHLATLSPAQQLALLRRIVPRYEATVRQRVRVNLQQHEYDALVSFAYNPGGRLENVTELINQGRVVKAMTEIKGVVKSGGRIYRGLVHRREREVNMFLTGKP